jgi:arylsulfatase A-like enzyme
MSAVNRRRFLLFCRRSRCLNTRRAEYEGGMTTLDLMPTMREAAGLPVPKRVQGLSRLGEIRRRELGWKAPVFLENITQNDVDGKPAIEGAARTPEWNLILRDHPKDALYDLIHDPGHEQKARIRELARLIVGWSEKTYDAVGAQFAKRYA